ncbi:MarR family winged helix-turn-helix transcriptional regulator [Actinoallomurus iriomotensis]|uniref:Transcriptional regulator n=1 Tax=Actinoallomurus iriomotensis TaxID=478107 RepID=A0A9W6W2H4_9ACTN|nr:MarR family winged helix-turn-helix transcriptional regulator [Actinoallomurus iriomotensis]GLY88449.1 transcriptional regulator [Actinoallomurus iriomotensis]
MDPLSPGELQVWQACKTLGHEVTRRVGAELTAVTGLSGSEYGLLSRLEELGGGRLGQQALADAMGWAKSRMSHQLTRMAARGIVRREKGPAGVIVVLTADGRELLARARPVHAAAVREHLIDRLGEAERAMLVRIAGRLAGEAEPAG